MLAALCCVVTMIIKTPSRIIGGALAEIEMISGYFVFEGFMYGFAPSAVNIPANGVQGAVGLILALILARILQKHLLELDIMI